MRGSSIFYPSKSIEYGISGDWFSIAAGLLVLASPVPAVPAESAPPLEEIIVTARLRPVASVDVPASSTVISQADLQAAGP